MNVNVNRRRNGRAGVLPKRKAGRENKNRKSKNCKTLHTGNHLQPLDSRILTEGCDAISVSEQIRCKTKTGWQVRGEQTCQPFWPSPPGPARELLLGIGQPVGRVDDAAGRDQVSVRIKVLNRAG